MRRCGSSRLRLCCRSGALGDRALPDVDRQWRRESDAECQGCAGALLCGGFGGDHRGMKRPSAAEPAKEGDAVVVPKQTGSQGFYKVWVSDEPMEAE